MKHLVGLPPIGPAAPRILILGSFPSAMSLERREYYGHVRNHFWRLLGAILGFDPGLPYPNRVARLEAAGIAVWDLFEGCERRGSLDQDIRAEIPNPLADFIASRPSLDRIALNGGKAASSFLALLAPGPRLPIGEVLEWRPSFDDGRLLRVARLPSSSPVPTRDYRAAADKLPLWSAFLR